MSKINVAEIVGKLIEILTPLESEERLRVVQATMTLLGETKITPPVDDIDGGLDNNEVKNLTVRTQTWMKQNKISFEELQQVFHFDDGEVAIIASEIPGKDKKAKTYSAYILTGIAQLLLNGEAKFTDESARKLCQTSGVYDSKNHAKHLRNKKNEFTGTKDRGWTLTSPGLKRGGQLVKELSEDK